MAGGRASWTPGILAVLVIAAASTASPEDGPKDAHGQGAKSDPGSGMEEEFLEFLGSVDDEGWFLSQLEAEEQGAAKRAGNRKPGRVPPARSDQPARGEER